MDSKTRSASASCPLQGTAETLALQAPLPDDDNTVTSFPAMISESLPRELVERILLFLDTEFYADMQAREQRVQRSHSIFHTVAIFSGL
ncbi:hypothetical protein M378DRAFT_171342 [Amanita muscaria Koide BX008]|uniref:Uncharacterized protein n=1 Tax=Amanita muscaria (strain Koide BX008) TaxID=946122 RepID=A0A0C2WNC8_AMAMK|nr:hypothetical protein M378DRAFT_171342 [Amanita muscaria Koide BX008]